MVSAISLGFHRIVDRLSLEPWSANMAVIIGHAAVFHDRSRDSPLGLVVLSLPRAHANCELISDVKRSSNAQEHDGDVKRKL
jgi:hypothetical protein